MKSKEELKKDLKKKRSKMFRFILLFVAVLGITLLLSIMVKEQSLPSSESLKVQCTVIEEQVNGRRINGAGYTKNACYVEYNGERYKLNNLKNVFAYPKGKTVEAYLYKGKMYADMAGVRTSSPIAAVYYLFLGGTFVMLIVMITAICYFSQAKKALKAFDPDAYKKYLDMQDGIYSVPEDRFR